MLHLSVLRVLCSATETMLVCGWLASLCEDDKCSSNTSLPDVVCRAVHHLAMMGYIGNVTLYGSLLAVGYLIALLRRGNALLKNGTVLQGVLPALKPLYAHAALSMILRPKTLPVSFLSRPLPSLSIASQSVVLDSNNLRLYRKLCGLPKSSTLPLIYPTVESFCLNLACMCMPSFPISVIGGVLARYTATMHKPMQESEQLTYR